MSELNINTTRNSINSQNLGINTLSNSDVEIQNKNSNASPSFHKIVSNFIEQRLHPKKESWTKDLLLELACKPIAFKSINDLDKKTQLNTVMYPILANLHRQGLVETKQNKDSKGTILTYRLTANGLVHSKAVIA